MAKKITKEVELCDVCGRESTWLQDCISCKNEFCVLCKAVIAGCMHSVECCKECGKNEKVNEIVMRHASDIARVIEIRDAELKQLKNT